MFYADDEQHALVQRASVKAADLWDGMIVTQLAPLGEWFPAEDYHQDFFAKNPNQGYCLAVAVPTVNKVRRSYAEYIKAAQPPFLHRPGRGRVIHEWLYPPSEKHSRAAPCSARAVR